MRFYGLKSCDTCRKAQKALVAAGHAPEVVDVRTDGVPASELARFHQAFGDALINTRSTTWRGLSDEERSAPPLSLLQAHPTLMKRPVIDRDGTLYLGWDKSVQAALIG